MKLLKDSHGMALVIVIFITAILLAFTAANLLFGQTNLKMTSHHKTGTMAYFASEAGIQHALRELDYINGVIDFDDIYGVSSLVNTTLLSNSSFSAGTAYTVKVVQYGSAPKRIKLSSEGTAPNGSKAVLETWFKKASVPSPRALLTNGDIRIEGAPWLGGTNGGAHSNDDIQITGNPGSQMKDGISASDYFVTPGGLSISGLDITGTPCIGHVDCSLPTGQQPAAYKLDTAAERDAYESSHTDGAPYTIPPINPASFASAIAGTGSGYVLTSNCTAFTGPGVVFSVAADSTYGKRISGGTPLASPPTGWSCSGGVWTQGGGSAANGAYYAETKVALAGNPGSAGNPWQLTLVARDTVIISGTPVTSPYLTASGESLQNVSVLTGNDLYVSGNAKINNGALFAHQQFGNYGNAIINNGFVIAGDGYPTWAGDPFPNRITGQTPDVTVNEVLGNPKIINDGLITGPYQAVIQIGQVQVM